LAYTIELFLDEIDLDHGETEGWLLLVTVPVRFYDRPAQDHGA
jgi:hypothetical protein